MDKNIIEEFIIKEFGLGAEYFDGIIYNAVFIEFDYPERYGEKYVIKNLYEQYSMRFNLMNSSDPF